MPIWNGLSFAERAVQPLSPEYTFNPSGESRLTGYYWIDWSALTSPDGVAPPLAGKALCGFGVVIADHDIGKFISYSPEFVAAGGLGGIPNPAITGGMLPYPHPDFPAGFYLAEQLGRVTGDLPAGLTARGGAAFDEGNVTVSFRCFPNHYRTLTDTVVKTPVLAANPATPLGDGSLLPNQGAPSEYYLTRNVEVTLKSTTVNQSLPPAPGAAGLLWADAPVGSSGRRPSASLAACVPLWAEEWTIDWYPVPADGLNYAAMQAIVGKTNLNPFPPSPPPGCPPSRMPQAAKGTLVFGQPEFTPIRMGNCAEALKVRLKIKRYPAGANWFWRYDRPAAEGGPGYARVARADGSVLFQAADYASAFVPP